MSGFPGPHSYSEFARRLPERDREESRQDVPQVPRTPDADDIVDEALFRARMIKDSDHKTHQLLERMCEYIGVLKTTCNQLEAMCRSTAGRRVQ